MKALSSVGSAVLNPFYERLAATALTAGRRLVGAFVLDHRHRWDLAAVSRCP